MRVSYLFIILICLFTSSFAQQKPLSTSLKSSAWRFIYKISADEARRFSKESFYLNPAFLHTKIDSFPIHAPIPQYTSGNYLIVYANLDKIEYGMVACGDLQIKPLLNYRKTSIILHQKNGSIIPNALVTSSRKMLHFHPETNTYEYPRNKIFHHAEVIYNNTFFQFENKTTHKNIFKTLWQRLAPIKRYFQKDNDRYRYYNYFHNPTPYENKFKGFLTFSKPRYKKGDTLQLKAFITNQKGTPIGKKLIVRMTDNNFNIDTIIGKITPYRKGAYVFDFVLNKAFDLDLDTEYLITLEEEKSKKFDLDEYDGKLDDNDYTKKRKVLIRNKFKLEDYELKSIQFKARKTLEEHFRSGTQSIFLKATDENDLPVMDGRVIITVMAQDQNAMNNFHNSNVFIADTLLVTEQKLDPVGETRYDLPDSIFPKANFYYSIHCKFLNSENESHATSFRAKFLDEQYHIDIKELLDSIDIQFKTNDRSVYTTSQLNILDSKKDTLQSISLSLPAKIFLPPMAAYVTVETSLLQKTWQLKSGRNKVTAITKRSADSLFIQLVNPSNLPVWYQLREGKHIIKKGYGTQWTWNEKLASKKNHLFVIHFLHGGQLYEQQFPLNNLDNQLQVTVDAPITVYPGQQTTIEVAVANNSGEPIANADITAYAITKKFKELSTPNVPYLGKTYPIIQNKIRWQNFEEKKFVNNTFLLWENWGKRLGLDTIEYYKLLHTRDLYLNTEQTPDSSTQFAPFIVSLGSIKPIHLLYVDEQPLYFKQSQQIANYSFPIDTNKHQLKFRTSNELITISDVRFKKGVKSILAISTDSSNHQISIQKMPDTLTKEEQLTLQHYTILVDQLLYAHRLSYIQQLNNFYLLQPDNNNYDQTKLVGPLLPQWSNYHVEDMFNTPFEVEGGQHFTIRNGWVKQKPGNIFNYYRNKLWNNDFNFDFKELVMNQKMIHENWEQYLFKQISNQYEPERQYKGNARLHISIEGDTPEHLMPLKKILLFKYDSVEFLNIMHPRNTTLKSLVPGWYRAMILYRNNQYLLKDSLFIQKYGVTHITLDTLHINAADSTSMAIAKILEDRFLGNQSDVASANKLLEQFNERYLNPKDLTGTVSGIVTDPSGHPVTGVSILIKGTRIGTTSDVKGYFLLRTPSQGTLLVQSVGYETIEKKISGSIMNFQLHENGSKLEEVVVIGYGARSKKDFTGSIAGKVAGLSVINETGMPGSAQQIMIRGAGDVQSNLNPLIVINGVIFEGDLADIDPGSITSMDVLKEAAATALYGSRATNGVIMITQNKSGITNSLDNVHLQGTSAGSLRTNFKDNAFWQPNLRTNSEGKVTFKVQFPDDITNWNGTFIAMTDKKQSGITEQSIRSFKPVSTQLLLPMFATHGDTINIIGKTLNYGMDSISVKRNFSVEGNNSYTGMIRFKNTAIDTFSVIVPPKDSLHLQLEIEKEGGYSDGEQRVIPIIRQGTEENTGFFIPLRKDTTIALNFDATQGNIIVHATASVLPVLLDETEQIRLYQYDCNEQLASKLKALLLQKKIHAILHTDFKHEKQIQAIIKRLQKSGKDGLWGWWENNEPVLWISLHVIESLLMAENDKYSITINKPFLIQDILYRANKSYGTERLYALRILKLLDAKIDYTNRLDAMHDELDSKNSLSQLQWMELKQSVGDIINIDSLLQVAKHTLMGNTYWGENEYRMFDNSNELTVMAYRLLKKSGRYEKYLDLIRGFFLEQRKSGRWNNTYQSSLILETILPDVYKEARILSPTKLMIHRNKKDTIDQFPYHGEFSPKEKIQIQKTGDFPVYFTAYQQQWNTAPQAIATSFSVHSSFKNQNNTLLSLRAGDNVDLQVKIELKEKANYIMIEIPIPAGCSYASKPQPQSNNEVHREYFREKTSIFCSELLPGTYTFSVPLTARFTGSFHLNPAKASLMYFPVMFGREGMKKIEIKGK